jgi:hypothetical protein
MFLSSTMLHGLVQATGERKVDGGVHWLASVQRGTNGVRFSTTRLHPAI